jgi:hypothetical protein
MSAGLANERLFGRCTNDITIAVKLEAAATDLTKHEDPIILRTLAAAYAEAHRFPEAVKTAEVALQFATAQVKTEVAENLAKELELYRRGSPYHETQP